MLASVTPTRRTALTVLAALAVGLLIVSLTMAASRYGVGFDALGKAGFKAGQSAISQLKSLFDMLKENLLYVAVVSFAAVGTFIGLLFMFGHTRAVDKATNVCIGVAIIIAIPGILA